MSQRLLALVVSVVFASSFAATAKAQHVTIGKVIGGDGFHLPSYVAMDRGFFKAEGLDVSLVELDPKIQVTAVLSGNLDCAPIPSGGAQAALSGAKITYIVGQSLKSQWTIVARGEINTVQDLKGLMIGYGHPGSSDYDEIQAVLHRFFQMDAGKDYKVIAFQGQPERIFCSGRTSRGSKRGPITYRKTLTRKSTMTRTLIRYKTKPEMAGRNAELVAGVFEELKTAQPKGVRYLSLRLDDDTFVHFVETESGSGNALPGLAAFKAFQRGIRERCIEPPQAGGATIVGNYRMLAEP